MPGGGRVIWRSFLGSGTFLYFYRYNINHCQLISQHAEFHYAEEEMMKSRPVLILAILVLMLLASCGQAATSVPKKAALATQAPALAAQPQAAATMQPVSAPTSVTYGDAGTNVSAVLPSQRKIIKNSELTLQVTDTDMAIDGVTQVTGDLGGYIISSRVWLENVNGVMLKYSTITLGIPVEQFETALRRLRGLSIKVLDEAETGEDVTDQYVDLQSQLVNLQDTRDRIRSFLDNAKTVDEALKVNQQLSDIEGQIEQIQGRMNFIQNRSAVSTITVTLKQQPPDFSLTPTRTPSPTLTPTPTQTPLPWKPGETARQAGQTLTSAYKGIVDILIWLLIFVVPILLIPGLIVWGIWYLAKRKKKQS
jgi:hypothetical protein